MAAILILIVLALGFPKLMLDAMQLLIALPLLVLCLAALGVFE